MNIQCKDLSSSQIYHLMVQTVVPRPIAWVLTEGPGAVLNLAPFSYFNAVSSDPNLLMISVGHKSTGEKKDTWQNLESRGHAVVHIPSSALAEKVSLSAAELPAEDSEVDLAQLETVVERGFSLPRLVDVKIAFDVTLYETKVLGRQGLLFLEVHRVFVADDSITEQAGRLKVDAQSVDPLARLGGSEYLTAGETLIVKRPK